MMGACGLPLSTPRIRTKRLGTVRFGAHPHAPMLSLERVRELMAGSGLSDAELEELRILAWQLAALAYELRRTARAAVGPLPTHPNPYEEEKKQASEP